MFFKENIDYDIYFRSSDEGILLIENVRILDLVNVGGRSFLVIHKKHGFKIMDEDGFVDFNSVVSILPSGEFRVITKGFRVK